MEATFKKEYSPETVNISALLELHSTMLIRGKELYSDFILLPIKRDFLVFTYTSSEDVRKEYWPIIIDGLIKYKSNPAAIAIWTTLFTKAKESESQAICWDDGSKAVESKAVGEWTQGTLL